MNVKLMVELAARENVCISRIYQAFGEEVVWGLISLWEAGRDIHLPSIRHLENLERAFVIKETIERKKKEGLNEKQLKKTRRVLAGAYGISTKEVSQIYHRACRKRLSLVAMPRLEKDPGPEIYPRLET